LIPLWYAVIVQPKELTQREKEAMAAKLRTMGLLVFTLMLFAACASATLEPATPTPLPPTSTPTPLPPTATPAPVEVIATKVEDLVGIWTTRFKGEAAYLQYRADGTFRIAYTVADLVSKPAVSGTFWFEGTLFNTKDNLCGKGTYEVRVQKGGDKPVQLSFTVVNDLCGPPVRDLRTKSRWVEP
jgi:hypothetical protein